MTVCRCMHHAARIMGSPRDAWKPLIEALPEVCPHSDCSPGAGCRAVVAEYLRTQYRIAERADRLKRMAMMLIALCCPVVLASNCTPTPPSGEAVVAIFDLHRASQGNAFNLAGASGHGSSWGLSLAGKWTRNPHVDSRLRAY